MLWNRIRQAIYAALTVIGFVWTNYYLLQFTIATIFLVSFGFGFSLFLFMRELKLTESLRLAGDPHESETLQT